MDTAGSSLVCSADVAAFVDALETINYNEAECYDAGENVVICVSEPDLSLAKDSELSVTDIEEACVETGGTYFNPDTRKLKAVMQQLVSQKKAIIIKKALTNNKGTKQFKSDVWNWFGDVRMFISESDAERLKIPYYMKLVGDEQAMICKVFVGCFQCYALFMYDAQKHSTSTLRYHVRACNRPKECIFVSEDKMEDEPSEVVEQEQQHLQQIVGLSRDGAAPRVKRFRTDPRKQKEVIEQLFQVQKAVVTRKSFMNIKGNRRFKSDVWNFFGDIKLLISRSEAKKLKIPYYIRKCGDEQLVLSKVFVGCFKCMALFIHDSQKSTSTLRYHIRTCSRPKERKKRSQPVIIFFPNKDTAAAKSTSETRPPGGEDGSEVIPAHEKLLNFALSTESSLEVLRDPSFHKMLQTCITVGAIYGDVNVDSLLCATPTLTNFTLNDLYIKAINDFYTEFQHSYGATYRLCMWVDEQMKHPYVSVHCSYGTVDGELKSVVIHTGDFDFETKGADQLQQWFSQFLMDQPVIPFKRLVAIDNESNSCVAFKDEPCVKCCIQNLTSAVQAVCSKGATHTNSEVPDFTNLLGNCVDLVDYFDQISEQYQLPEELTRCVDDKWTSILALFRSVDSQYEAILNGLNAMNAIHMLSVEKTAITAFVEFFKVFEEAVIQLSSHTEPTLNLLIPWVAKLQRHCTSERDDPPALKQFKSSFSVELTDKVAKSISVYHRMATFLDPRFKKMGFGPPADHKETSVRIKCLVKECMESPNMEELAEGRRAGSHHPPDPSKAEQHSGGAYDTGKCEKAALEEVDRYAAEAFHLVGHDLSQQSKFPVLRYWKQHADEYPNLCKIAFWLLSCPASFTQQFDTFWTNGWLVHCPRFPVQPDNVNKVLFVRSFLNLCRE